MNTKNRRSFLKTSATAIGSVALMTTPATAKSNTPSAALKRGPNKGKPCPSDENSVLPWLSSFSSKIYYMGASTFGLLSGQPDFTRQLILRVDNRERFVNGLAGKRPESVSNISAEGNFIKFSGSNGNFLLECLNSELFDERVEQCTKLSQEVDSIEYILYDPLTNELKDPRGKFDALTCVA